MDTMLKAAVLAAALGAGVVAGVFHAFSTFVMRALGGLSPGEGVRAMQAINRTAVGPGLMTAFLGTAVVCGGVAAWAVTHRDDPAAPWALAGAGLYLLGALLPTVARNVPLNDALAALDAGADGAPAAWRSYRDRWTAWNHVRAGAAIGAAGLLVAAWRRI